MKQKLLALLLCIIIAGGFITGCSPAAYSNAVLLNSEKRLASSDKEVQAEEPDPGYTEGLNRFAHRIFSGLTGDGNVFISPYSISMALSMLYNGADGGTRQEMAELLGYDLLAGYTDNYNDAANQTMNSYSRYIREALQKADQAVTIDTANSVWLAKGMQFKSKMEEALLAPARNYYNADIFQVDFNDDKTLDNVNKWVADHTDGMIDPFLEEFRNKEDIRLFLANAIYFNGKWSNPFSPDKTDTASFYGLDSTQSVDMMHMYGERYRYYTGSGLRGIEIPYGNESIVMDVFIPEKAGENIGEVYNSLSADDIAGFLKQLDASAKTKINTLALPKFELEYGLVSLNDVLQDLGMEAAFGDAADFSLIGDNLFVDEVAHKAKIQVEEWGTKASAATGITVDTTSAEILEPVNFIVEVPFIFLIRDKQSGSILFMGEMDQMD